MRRLLIVLGAFLALAAPAGAASRIDIYRDCEPDGRLQGTYTPAEIRDARQNIPSDLAEYSDCIDALRRAELSGNRPTDPTTPVTPDDSGGTGRAGGTGTGTSATPEPELVPETQEDHDALAGALDGPDQPLAVAGVDGAEDLTPLRSGGYDANALPGPLVVALVLLALAGLALCVPPLRRRALPLLRRR